MSTHSQTVQPLPTSMRIAIAATAAIDLILGLLFLFAPELKIDLWPNPINPVLTRFIGSIVFANGIGALMLSLPGTTWEGARVLIMVAMVYGAIIFLGLLYHIVFQGDTEPFYITYVIVDVIFFFPILLIFLRFESQWRKLH